MRLGYRTNMNRLRSCFVLTISVILAYTSYITEVKALPTESSSNPWPSFPRRNVAALARDGYLKSVANGYKRSISTLAKNGMLPTYRAPYSDSDKPEQEDEESHEKRNLASIARLRSYSAMKRNIQALARDGFRFGRTQYGQPNDKRNIAALARNGLIHKRDELAGDEYYYPFYQNSVPPLSEMDGPLDFNEIYDYQQSINPDVYPPLQQVFKRSDAASIDYMNKFENDADDANWYFKRGVVGMPVHGLYRPMFIDSNSPRNKRSIFSIPDVIDRNDITLDTEDYDTGNDDKRSVDEEMLENFEKRHIGSLARLGWLPSFRYSGGRYSRSGRGRFLFPNQMERKHSYDENFGSREYLVDSEASTLVDPNDADIPSPPVSAHSHPTGRYLHRTLNDLPNDIPNSMSSATSHAKPSTDPFTKNRWPHNKAAPKFYYFRSLKVPYHSSGKRYLLLPAVDNILLRKTYNNSLPSRRKNQ
ncbi:neuropeptide-like precursor 1 [Zerene cesonia]|uniref:neuropeptide-like precursor 1 n=1 Tax=Zerene cesonia TaxID=33412 RepID=UPI0018E58C03|nr:neuropeptide-like precursor 1 [Zerene cesonia]